MYVHSHYTLLGSKPEALEYHFHRLLHLIVRRRYNTERRQSNRRHEALYARRAGDT
jgi:hypothetical protein